MLTIRVCFVLVRPPLSASRLWVMRALRRLTCNTGCSRRRSILRVRRRQRRLKSNPLYPALATADQVPCSQCRPLATQNAVQGRQTKVRISVQGKSSAAVVLDALHVRVVGRDTPDGGTAYNMGQGCGSDEACAATHQSIFASASEVPPVASRSSARSASAASRLRLPTTAR